MAAKGEEAKTSLPRLFSELQLAGEEGDFDLGLKVTEKILLVASEDAEAIHCKVVCLLQLSRFNDAISLIDTLNKKGQKPSLFQFEKAYCLYRLEKYGENTSVLQSLPQDEHRVRELSAQIVYRLEKYDQARTSYASMIRELSDEFSTEREANYSAALSLCGEQPDGTHLEALHSETMEQCFNVACCYLAQGQAPQAEGMLRRAEDLCRESLQEDDLTEEEMESELSVVRIQVGFAKQLQGEAKEALGVYTTVLRQKPGDVSHTIVASNNIIVLNRDRDIFDSKKRVKVLANDGRSKKLISSQKYPIVYNRCLFALQTNQLETCRGLVAELKQVQPESSLTVLAESALLSRERKTSACIHLLESHLKGNPGASLLVYASLAQLLLVQGDMRKTCSVLRSIPDVSQHVGVISMLVSLYTNAGDVNSAIEVLDGAITWWSKQALSQATQKTLRSLMLESAQYKLHHGKPDAAAAVLEKLYSQDSSDLPVQAKLVSAYSRFNPKKAEELSLSLPSSGDAREVDVDTLEQMPSFRHTRRQLLKPDTTAKPADTKDVVAKKKKKKRKPRLPKNYDPSAAPDAERWLPLRERSYYRRGRKTGFTAVRGTQGSSLASAALAAQLDASRPKPAAASDTAGKQAHLQLNLLSSILTNLLTCPSSDTLLCYSNYPFLTVYLRS